jgi:hypothetical protein
MSDAEFEALPDYSDIESRTDSEDSYGVYDGYELAASSLDGAGPDNFGRVADSLASSPTDSLSSSTKESLNWPPTPGLYSQTYRLHDGESISTLDRSLIGIPSLGGASVASLPPLSPPPGFSPTPRHVYSFDTPSLFALNPDYRVAALNITLRGSSRTTVSEAAPESHEENDCVLHIGDGLPPRDPQRQSIARKLDGQRYPWIITPGRPSDRPSRYL